MKHFEARAIEVLAELRQQSLHRQHIALGGLDFISNDYLGLGKNLSFREATWRACENLAPGSSASRHLGGDHPAFAALEDRFTHFKNAESSLYFPSGYVANESIIMALSQSFPSIHFFSDEHNHASTVHGLKTARSTGAVVSIFKHQDFDQLREQIQESKAAFKIICTESVFSMHGSLTDVRSLAMICEEFECFCILDEAHAIGVFGEKGEGRWSGNHPLFATLNTCGKALATQGALVCGPTWLRRAMLHFSRPAIYSTAPSPWMATATRIAIDWVENAHESRQSLRDMSAIWSQSSPIVMWTLSSNEEALRLGHRLLDNKIHVGVVRHPTVPQPALRISIHAHQNTDQHRELRSFLQENQNV